MQLGAPGYPSLRLVAVLCSGLRVTMIEEFSDRLRDVDRLGARDVKLLLALRVQSRMRNGVQTTTRAIHLSGSFICSFGKPPPPLKASVVTKLCLSNKWKANKAQNHSATAARRRDWQETLQKRLKCEGSIRGAREEGRKRGMSFSAFQTSLGRTVHQASCLSL